MHCGASRRVCIHVHSSGQGEGTIGGLDHWTGLLDSPKSFPELVPRLKLQYHWCALIRIIVRHVAKTPGLFLGRKLLVRSQCRLVVSLLGGGAAHLCWYLPVVCGPKGYTVDDLTEYECPVTGPLDSSNLQTPGSQLAVTINMCACVPWPEQEDSDFQVCKRCTALAFYSVIDAC